MINSLTVYCSSSTEAPQEYFEAAASLGKSCAALNISLVFGGGRVGLMGCIADAVMQNGGTARGIIPRFLEEREVAHYGLSELTVVETMHERKMKLAEWGDAYLVLPGGLGTLDELLEVMTWKHLGHHHKPIILLNLNGFWNPLLEFFGRIAEERMVNSRYKDYYTICNSTEEAASLLQSHNTKADTTP
ncbi:TIGR00730 family Rossman fold protein [Chlorobium phaeovibrioides]|uniref:Cytokinin riboside 5'-monophosphate phosphoribohydrolase n=2 Tax=Chlorobium phaeovibrioides TaxID=1094 RepID=A0A3S0LRM5_CHLPH|nr:TIGR00730 family Rossman fold protein [Chlorobium phaeovibrioides]HCD35605.1 TIGR00730 family Rossman fold protein [Chlorobium sp.]KAA6232363.1 TIGR00730 family Rossman fold protein [Chlorobium phaeovibrioides]MWV54106.1 TIGR00730 family Rossman fold protein [Chlorobium phaeovibrioides]QEQ57132.1 TIGR00730 family Rossman fold protein [Chlorobium phaeovibrioides]RTY35101.1 TIGR00730 family Rossman fold protein [Chlorobium phaeovibrioides]